MEKWIPNLGEVKKSTRKKGGDGAMGTSVTRPHRQQKDQPTFSKGPWGALLGPSTELPG